MGGAQGVRWVAGVHIDHMSDIDGVYYIFYIPFLASSRAVSFPIPVLDPVTIAVFSAIDVNSMMIPGIQ